MLIVTPSLSGRMRGVSRRVFHRRRSFTSARQGSLSFNGLRSLDISQPPGGGNQSGFTERNTDQVKAIAEIDRLGGKVIADPDKVHRSTAVWGVVLAWTDEVTDAGLAHLEALTQLQYLDLSVTKITDAGLKHVKGLVQLQSLNLQVTKVADAGLEHLKGLTKLQVLNLWRTQVTDTGLVHLQGLTKLQVLNLSETQVTDAGLIHLKGLTQLKMLDLSRPRSPTLGWFTSRG